MHRAVLLLVACLAAAPGVTAQDAVHADYFRSVARYFSLPAEEVSILAEWEIEPDEVPVVLFVARRSGVSPEAVVALRDAGQSWAALTSRFRVTASALHVPIRDDAPAGALAGAYERFRSTPVSEWSTLPLNDGEIVGLVNVRVISQVLGLSAERVAAESGSTATYVQLHARLRR
jgi:hypothetical protein